MNTGDLSAHKKISLPCHLIYHYRETLIDRASRAVVVSFVGKSDLKSRGSKASPADIYSDRRIFASGKTPEVHPKKSVIVFPCRNRRSVLKICVSTQVLIEGYHDVDNKVLFLHLRSSYDAFHFDQILGKINDDKKVNIL